MFLRTVILLVILCIPISAGAEYYTQTLNMGDEEYFVQNNDDNTKEETSSKPIIQYIENNYYTPQTQYTAPYSTYGYYPNTYGYSGFGYTISSPVYRPVYYGTKPFPVSPVKPVPQVNQKIVQPKTTTNKPFSYNFGH